MGAGILVFELQRGEKKKTAFHNSSTVLRDFLKKRKKADLIMWHSQVRLKESS